MKLVITLLLPLLSFFSQVLGEWPSCDLATNYKSEKEKRQWNRRFNRISTFLVCTQMDEKCDTHNETAARIVTATEGGMTLIYTDHMRNNVGFVDISDS